MAVDSPVLEKKMLVEVWSDVMCPFCYFGKQRFARALASFAQRHDVDVLWRGFQLDASLRAQPGMSTHEWLARSKGMRVETAREMNNRIAMAGQLEGLTYDFDRVVVANTFKAHQLMHFARAFGRQDAAVDRIFRAHFADGLDVGDDSVLVRLAVDVGLDGMALAQALASERYAGDVRADIAEARKLGISGVPFFVFNRAYAISGAQEPSAFLAALEQSFSEWRQAA